MKLKSALILLLFPFLCSFTMYFRVTNSYRLVNTARSVFLLDVDEKTIDVFDAFKRRSLLQYLSRLNEQYFNDTVRMVVVHAPSGYLYLNDRAKESCYYFQVGDVRVMDSLRQIHQNTVSDSAGYVLSNDDDFLKYHYYLKNNEKTKKTVVLHLNSKNLSLEEILKLFYAEAKYGIVGTEGSLSLTNSNDVDSILKARNIAIPDMSSLLSEPYFADSILPKGYAYPDLFIRNDSFHLCESISGSIDTSRLLCSFENIWQIYRDKEEMLVFVSPRRFYYYNAAAKRPSGMYELPYQYSLDKSMYAHVEFEKITIESQDLLAIRMYGTGESWLMYVNVLSGYLTLDSVGSSSYLNRLTKVNNEDADRLANAEVNIAHSPQWHYDAAKDNKKNALLALITMLFIAGVYRYNKKRK